MKIVYYTCQTGPGEGYIPSIKEQIPDGIEAYFLHDGYLGTPENRGWNYIDLTKEADCPTASFQLRQRYGRFLHHRWFPDADWTIYTDQKYYLHRNFWEECLSLIENATTELGGSLDCIVNNAGITQDNLAIRMSLDEWRRVIDINLTSTFLMSKFAIKKMLKNKSGKIVNITSVVGHMGNLGQANYTASKAGIVAMSKSLAIEYAKKNINVNCISPGFIKTAMTDKIDEKFKETIISKIPSARLGEPEDIANAVGFLCSDQSSYINGETLHVNGGMYMA